MDTRDPLRLVQDAIDAIDRLLLPEMGPVVKRFSERFLNEVPSPVPSQPNLVGAEEAAKYLDIKIKLLYSLTRKGIIKGSKIGKYFKYRLEDLNAFIDANSCVAERRTRYGNHKR